MEENTRYIKAYFEIDEDTIMENAEEIGIAEGYREGELTWDEAIMATVRSEFGWVAPSGMGLIDLEEYNPEE